MQAPELSEGELQALIIEYLKLHHIFHWRNAVGGAKRKGFFVQFGTRGSPDICCLLRCTFLGVEVKRRTGIQSREQYCFEQEIKKAGCHYVLARSLEDVIAAVKGIQ